MSVMSDPHESSTGYAKAYDSYWSQGWRGVLPLPPRAKVWPPSIKCADARAKRQCQNGCECVHYTGYAAVVPSYPDVMAWAEQYPDGNLCLHLPDGFVGVDVDAYGAKTGARTIVEAERRWGPLPSSPRSSSRDNDLISGIRIYQVPPGTALETRVNFPDLGIGDIEIVQRHHRYVVSWPSIHPEGGTYQWRDEHNAMVPIPKPEELPWLPQAWIDGLKVQPRTQFDGPIDFDVVAALTPGDPSTAVRKRLGEAFVELNRPGSSRHDVCCRHVLALARLGKSGEFGVKTALQQLCDVFVAVVITDGSRTPESARGEFIRMLTNDNLARELSKPGITDWLSALVVEDLQVAPRETLTNLQVGQRQPETAPIVTDMAGDGTEGPINGTEPTRNAPNDPGDDSGPSPRNEGPDAMTNAEDPPGRGALIVDDSAPHSPLIDIERGFWESRESLAMVYQTALARMASPWAVLGICAARALTTVRPNVTLPPLIGGPGSLNWFCALVARSGGGKGAANAAANLLIPKSAFKQKTIGSGEGLVKLFDRPKDAGPEDDVNEAVLVNVDEVDTLTALGQRSASTTIAVLKQAFSGEALGFTYVNRANLRDVQDHEYRMTLVVSVQPRKAGGLLADEGGGLPQRFMWFPAGDKRITTDERWPSGPLNLPAPGEWLYPREVAIPDEAWRFIRENRRRNAHEELDALDGHAVFSREKFAYALAVMEGRVTMTLEDWELSGIAADVSIYTREMCIDQLKEAARLDAIERGQIRGIEMESADVEKLQEQVKRGQRVLRWIMHKLDAAEGGFLTQSELMVKVSGRDRRALAQILEAGHQALRAELVDGAVRWSRA